jgi:hypothetical protein
MTLYIYMFFPRSFNCIIQRTFLIKFILTATGLKDEEQMKRKQKYVYTRRLSNKEGTLFPTAHHKITANRGRR